MAMAISGRVPASLIPVVLSRVGHGFRATTMSW